MKDKSHETPYCRVSCDFYDQLEIHAMRRSQLRMLIEKPGSSAYELDLKIKILKTENGDEFLISDNQEKIRLDYIKSMKAIDPG